MSETAPRQVDTAKLARDILDRTATAGTEEDLKMRVEPLLRRAFHDIGVDVNIVAYERATALSSKRMDAVYGYVVIEYKGPGKLATPALAQDAPPPFPPKPLLPPRMPIVPKASPMLPRPRQMPLL
jgi:hypothetical protein